MRLTAVLPRLVLLPLLFPLSSLCQELEKESKPDALVTLLFGSGGFHLGVRVLGQSIRESKTKLDRVVLCTRDVPSDTVAVLRSDGWKIKMVDYFDVGDAKFDERIVKMQIWTLTEYRRIIWLDADTVLVQNVDHLARCGNFCATYRHSDLFNSGVMVLKPSLIELKKIMSFISRFLEAPVANKALALPPGADKWGDQNLLNEFYNTVYKLQRAKLFDESDPTYHKEPMRLPEGYNTDYALYLWHGTWSVQEKDRYILHYTAGPLKPHLWWTYPLCDANWIWYGLRQRLPHHSNDPSIWHLFNWIPLLVLVLLFAALRFIPRPPCLILYSKRLAAFISPMQDNWIMFFTPTLILSFSYYLAFKQVPPLLWPGEAWVVFGMWTIMFISIFLVPICYILYTSASPRPRSNYARMSLETLLLFVTFILLHLIGLWIAYLVYPSIHRLIFVLFLFCVVFIYFHFSSKRLMRLWFQH